MAVRFDKSEYERVKQQRSASQVRQIALAEIRAAFTPNTTVYAAVAYLTHLFEDKPEIFKQAESITMDDVLNQPSNSDEGSTGVFSETTRSRLHSKEVAKMRECILEVMEAIRDPRSADEIIDEAIELYERTDYEIRISKHKWMAHFSGWRQKEPALFSKTHRQGSNSEKDSLWQLAKFNAE